MCCDIGVPNRWSWQNMTEPAPIVASLCRRMRLSGSRQGIRADTFERAFGGASSR